MRVPDPRRPRVGFIGAGRVGKGLSLALSRAGYTVALAGRGAEEKKRVFAASDLILLTVPDDALSPACQEFTWNKDKSAVHCSGAAELSVLHHASAQGAPVGGFHPLQMFADPDVAARGLRGCAIAIEAAEPLATSLFRMVEDLGARPLRVPPGARAAYHAAAHYAGPFIAALLDEGASVWRRLGIPHRDALAALVALARGSLDAIDNAGPAHAMAGSVARGDLGTIERHLAALGAAERELYCRLALRTVPLAVASGKLDAARAERVRATLERGLKQ